MICVCDDVKIIRQGDNVKIIRQDDDFKIIWLCEVPSLGCPTPPLQMLKWREPKLPLMTKVSKETLTRAKETQSDEEGRKGGL